MSKRNKNFKIYIVLFILGFLFSASFVFAATVGFSPGTGNYHVGDTIQEKVIVNSDTSINAIASHVSFPANLLTLSSISKEGSIISLWPQEPSFSNANGTADLEGVVLNGYTGNAGSVATLVFKAKDVGQAVLQFSGVSVLANDGNGTEVLTGSSSATLAIAKALPKVENTTPEVKPTPVENVVEKTKEVVAEVRQVEQVNNLPDYSLVIVLMLLIIVLLLLIIIFGIYYINKFRNYIKKKLKKTEEDVTKEFETLEKDIYKEAVIEQKVKDNVELSGEEKTALVDFKQDIKNTEKDILKDIKDTEESN
jgi:ABC-type multidrug transport system fused ATPase/permease subunit